MLLSINIPHEPFNTHVRNGSVGAKMARIMEAIKPESIYFTEQNGHRGAIAIVEVPDPSKIPVLAEPWFLLFNADVSFRIAMTPEDLKKSGIDEIGKKWGS
jgi:hypothetical protein